MKNRNNVDVPSKYGLFVNGEFAEAASGETFEVVNPASGEKIAEVARARRFSDLVYEAGVFATKIGSPYVPPGTSRLRAIISADHSTEMLSEAIDVFDKTGGELGVI